jgi:hypothetical protein
VLYNLSIVIAWLVERKRSAVDAGSDDPASSTESPPDASAS